jgi:hypothetical protein
MQPMTLYPFRQQVSFTFSYGDRIPKLLRFSHDGKPIENKLIYGSVTGKKITENGEELGRALSDCLRLMKPNLQKKMLDDCYL